MKKISKIMSVCVAAMGLVHIAATFTPLIASKLQMLDQSAQGSFVYFSLMCGAFLLVGGIVALLLLDKVADYAFLRKPLLLLTIAMAADGLLAAFYMPRNPFAWTIFALTAVLAISSVLCSKK